MVNLRQSHPGRDRICGSHSRRCGMGLSGADAGGSFHTIWSVGFEPQYTPVISSLSMFIVYSPFTEHLLTSGDIQVLTDHPRTDVSSVSDHPLYIPWNIGHLGPGSHNPTRSLRDEHDQVPSSPPSPVMLLLGGGRFCDECFHGNLRLPPPPIPFFVSWES